MIAVANRIDVYFLVSIHNGVPHFIQVEPSPEIEQRFPEVRVTYESSPLNYYTVSAYATQYGIDEPIPADVQRLIRAAVPMMIRKAL